MFSLYQALKSKNFKFFFSIMKYIFTLGICNMPAIRSSKHNSNKKQGRTHKMNGGYKNFTIFFYRNTKPNQTKQAHSPFCLQIGLCSTVSPWRQKHNLLTPMSQVSRLVSEPKGCRVTSENPSDPEDNSPQMLPVFLWIPPIPIMQTQNSIWNCTECYIAHME